MWNLFGRYKGKKALPSARQMNLIAAILNHVTQGTGISMQMPQQPSTDAPWIIAVDTEWLKEFVGGGGSGYSGAANSLVKSDANGQLDALVSLLTTAPTSDKVLTVKKNGTAVSWDNASAEEPASPTSLEISGEGGVNANYNGNTKLNPVEWTAGGSKGVSVTVQTRTYYDHTATTPVMYGYYRTFTFDKYGRLYHVSGETRYPIDQPTVVNWS